MIKIVALGGHFLWLRMGRCESSHFDLLVQDEDLKINISNLDRKNANANARIV
jgi:hypothetical protein